MAKVSVTISPDVISSVVRNTALATPGVMALVEPEQEHHTFGVRRSLRGVNVKLAEGRAFLSLRVIAAADVPLHELSRQLRQSVAEVVEEVTGIQVASVDIRIEDVRK